MAGGGRDDRYVAEAIGQPGTQPLRQRRVEGDLTGDGLGTHQNGLATQATSTTARDGQPLIDTRITLGVRCAPPGNKPTTVERDACSPWLVKELSFVLPTAAVVIALGGFAWTALLNALRTAGVSVPTPLPAFGHGVEVTLDSGLVLLGCYHVSQQNTFTGRLTEPMLDAVLQRAQHHAGLL